MQLDLESKDRIILRLKQDWQTDRRQWKQALDELRGEVEVLVIERDSLRAHILVHAPHIVPPAERLPDPHAANGLSHASSPAASQDRAPLTGKGSAPSAPSSSHSDGDWPDSLLPAGEGLGSLAEGSGQQASQSPVEQKGRDWGRRQVSRGGLSDNIGARHARKAPAKAGPSHVSKQGAVSSDR